MQADARGTTVRERALCDRVPVASGGRETRAGRMGKIARDTKYAQDACGRTGRVGQRSAGCQAREECVRVDV